MPWAIKSPAILRIPPPSNDVGMGMAGVVMIDRDPVEVCLQVLLHLSHEVARKSSQISHFTGILGRDNKAELMPIFTAPLDKGLAVGLVLESRIGLSFLAVPVDPIPFEIAKMGIDRPARRLGLLGAMRSPLPPLGVEPDDPRLDRDAA